jgi:hypothetical protein
MVIGQEPDVGFRTRSGNDGPSSAGRHHGSFITATVRGSRNTWHANCSYEVMNGLFFVTSCFTFDHLGFLEYFDSLVRERPPCGVAGLWSGSSLALGVLEEPPKV